MKNQLKNKTSGNKKSSGEIVDYKETEKELNAKILKITMRIKDQHPELSKYIEEMQVTIPSDKNPEVTLAHLRTYYESLNTMLGKYILEHPPVS
ncbi:MAG: hypothetical protein IAF38_12025 [Bacteroidia bacterium]|nr:hypothetical protein [Bacteroidia bacterium]